MNLSAHVLLSIEYIARRSIVFTNKALSELILNFPFWLPYCLTPIHWLPRALISTDKCPIRQSGVWQTQTRVLLFRNVLMARCFLFVSRSLTHSNPALTMDHTAPPPNSTTPTRQCARAKLADAPKNLARITAPSSQPVGSTQRALQESLTGNIVFANEATVDAIFQPSKVDDQIIVDILFGLDNDRLLKEARNSVLSSKHTETKKSKSLVHHQMLKF